MVVARPDPDPTILTTQQLLRESALLKEAVETRFEGMDKAIELLQKFADKSPTTTVLEQQILALKEMVAEKAESNATASAKQESAFTKLIDQIQQTQQVMDKSTDVKINAINGRLDRGEGHSKGSGDVVGYIFGAAGFVTAVAAVVALLLK